MKKLIWNFKAPANKIKNLYIRRATATVAGLICFGAAVSSTQAATITVTTASDVVDGIVTSITSLIANPGADTKISLREAISAANNTSGSDIILFDSTINGTPIIIDITGTDEDLNGDGDLDITDANGLTITGNGQGNTIIDGNDNERVLDVLFGALSITALTVRNGDETVNSAPGGGIRAGSDAGNLTVTQSTVADNTAEFGAGIYSRASGSTVTLTNSTFTGNEGYSGSGGAFRVSSSNIQLSVDGCTITGNTAESAAGVSFGSGGGTAEISNSIVSGNTSTEIDAASGAIRHDATGGVMTINHSEISGNIAAGDGGGIHLDGTRGALSITNSTISGNRADRHGGGITVDSTDSTLNLNFVTITNNIADDDANGTGEGGGIDITETDGTPIVNIHNSIIQGNDDETSLQTDGDDCGTSGSGTYVSQDGNVFGTNTGCLAGASDTVDPANLGSLADNGGTTKTHALLSGSAALNFADCGAITTDQRDELRKGGNCDAGAFEFYKFPWHMFMPAFKETTL